MNGIIHMKHAMIERENISAAQDAEIRKRTAARTAAMEICAALREYFDAKSWAVWCDAIPDNVYEFREYAQAEADNCAAETAKIAEWLTPPSGSDLHDADREAWDEFCKEVEDTRRTDRP